MIFIAGVTMKQFRLPVIALLLAVSALADAGELVSQGERISRSVVNGNATASNSYTAAGASANVGKSVVHDFNFTKIGASYYFESSKASHVPEPQGWAMMLLGAGFVVYQVRRRKRPSESWDLR